MISFFKKNYQGVGINLRLELIDEIIAKKPKLEYLELIADNWLSNGPHHKKLEKLREDYKILFHCVGMNIGGLDPLDKSYLNSIRLLADKFEPEHVSDHLCFQSYKGHHHHDLLPIAYNESSLLRCSERIDMIQTQLKDKILVENLSYYIEFENSTFSEVHFLNELRSKTNCSFILDLNNIWTNEKNLNIKAADFLDKIDSSGVREIHIAGSQMQANLFIDTHGSLPPTELFELLNKLNYKVPVIYERDQNITPLKETLKVLKMIKKSIS